MFKEDLEGKKVEWIEKAEIRETDFLAVGEACKATFSPIPALKVKTFDSSGFPGEGTFISEFATTWPTDCLSIVRQLWGNVWEMGRSTDGLSQAHRYLLELNRSVRHSIFCPCLPQPRHSVHTHSLHYRGENGDIILVTLLPSGVNPILTISIFPYISS